MHIPPSTPTRPRLVGETILFGKATVLAHRTVRNGLWVIDRPADDVLAALLSAGYGKTLSPTDPAVVAVVKAASLQQRDRQQAEATLATLPAPTPGGLERLPLAEKLLAEGTRPADLAKAPRRAPLGLPPMPAYCESLRLTDQGVVLGKGTVIAALDDRADGGTGLVIDEDRIVALLAVASGTMPTPEPVIRHFACASRALAKGDPTLATIALAQLGQPPLAHNGFAKALELAADELGRGTDPVALMKGLGMKPLRTGQSELRKVTKYSPDQPRDYHGRWTDGGDGDGTGSSSSDVQAIVDGMNSAKPANGATQVADNRPANTANDASGTGSGSGSSTPSPDGTEPNQDGRKALAVNNVGAYVAETAGG